MSSPSDEWQELCADFSTFARHIEKNRTVNVNAKPLRVEATDVAQTYFRNNRPRVQHLWLDAELAVLDEAFRSLLQLSSGANATSSYKRQIKTIRRVLTQVTARIELSHSVATAAPNTTAEDDRLIRTLEELVPSAALSYRQAVIDLADEGRLSFRGPALELREALRETLDHLAPDADVKAMAGYVQEKDRDGPTMKQKVRFILKSRGQSKAASTVSEQSTTTVEEMVGTLTRSIYTLSSVATHVASERKQVIQIRRYVVAALHDILEL